MSTVDPCEAASHATPSRILLIGEGTRNVSCVLLANIIIYLSGGGSVDLPPAAQERAF
jgi:hypothetical protein